MLAVTTAFPACALGASTPAPGGTPPPQIYHIVTTPLCARLHDQIRPAVALILENDRTIAKSHPLFKQYAIGAFGSLDAANNPMGNPAPAGNDSINVDSPATQMALQKMSYLVSPIAQSLIAAQTVLDTPVLLKPTGNPSDDAKLADVRKQLLETVAFQSASLDLINGFVATQQMGQLQHAGETLIEDVTGGNSGGNSGGSAATPMLQPATPSPLQDPNTPGLKPNPYALDLVAVPGLAVGYNPLNRLVGALQWLQTQTTGKENAAASTLSSAIADCNRIAAPASSPSP
jgi:hypothetical protein